MFFNRKTEQEHSITLANAYLNQSDPRLAGYALIIELRAREDCDYNRIEEWTSQAQLDRFFERWFSVWHLDLNEHNVDNVLRDSRLFFKGVSDWRML